MCPYLVVHILEGRTAIAPNRSWIFLNFSRKPLSESRLGNFARENVRRTMRHLFSRAKSCRAYRLLKNFALDSAKIHCTVRNRTRRRRFAPEMRAFKLISLRVTRICYFLSPSTGAKLFCIQISYEQILFTAVVPPLSGHCCARAAASIVFSTSVVARCAVGSALGVRGKA